MTASVAFYYCYLLITGHFNWLYWFFNIYHTDKRENPDTAKGLCCCWSWRLCGPWGLWNNWSDYRIPTSTKSLKVGQQTYMKLHNNDQLIQLFILYFLLAVLHGGVTGGSFSISWSSIIMSNLTNFSICISSSQALTLTLIGIERRC